MSEIARPVATTSTPLAPLPQQPPDTPWPTDLWPVAEPVPDGEHPVDVHAVQRQLDTLFHPRQAKRIGRTLAVVVIHRGHVVAERSASGTAASQRLISWSTAKSMLNAVVGILVGRGLLDLDAPAAVPEWQAPGDARASITLRDLLQFRPGLEWAEDYVDDTASDVIAMLFGDGQADMAAFAANKPLVHEPGSAFNYSSGTSNIVSRIVRDAIAESSGCERSDVDAVKAVYSAFLARELFGPLGMRTADPRFDPTGTWIASSYCYCTPRDFARFAHLYLRDGVWEGRRLLPEGWVDFSRRPTSVDAEGDGHGAHFWLWDANPWGAFNAAGYEGQYLVVVPELDVVLVRLGKTVAELRPALRRELTSLIEAFAG
jgi:CubicO group peptidase (beta-lactamase class C family)